MDTVISVRTDIYESPGTTLIVVSTLLCKIFMKAKSSDEVSFINIVSIFHVVYIDIIMHSCIPHLYIILIFDFYIFQYLQSKRWLFCFQKSVALVLLHLLHEKTAYQQDLISGNLGIGGWVKKSSNATSNTIIQRTVSPNISTYNVHNNTASLLSTHPSSALEAKLWLQELGHGHGKHSIMVKARTSQKDHDYSSGRPSASPSPPTAASGDDTDISLAASEPGDMSLSDRNNPSHASAVDLTQLYMRETGEVLCGTKSKSSSSSGKYSNNNYGLSQSLSSTSQFTSYFNTKSKYQNENLSDNNTLHSTDALHSKTQSSSSSGSSHFKTSTSLSLSSAIPIINTSGLNSSRLSSAIALTPGRSSSHHNGGGGTQHQVLSHSLDVVDIQVHDPAIDNLGLEPNSYDDFASVMGPAQTLAGSYHDKEDTVLDSVLVEEQERMRRLSVGREQINSASSSSDDVSANAAGGGSTDADSNKSNNDYYMNNIDSNSNKSRGRLPASASCYPFRNNPPHAFSGIGGNAGLERELNAEDSNKDSNNDNDDNNDDSYMMFDMEDISSSSSNNRNNKNSNNNNNRTTSSSSSSSGNTRHSHLSAGGAPDMHMPSFTTMAIDMLDNQHNSHHSNNYSHSHSYNPYLRSDQSSSSSSCYWESGYCTILGPRSKNEDRLVALPDLFDDIPRSSLPFFSPSVALSAPPQRQGYFAVYDGHCGDEASTYLQHVFHARVCQHENYYINLNDAIIDTCLSVDSEFLKLCASKKMNCGTTALGVFIRDNELTVYNIGDCSAVLAASDGTILSLSDSHKPHPQRGDERARILAANGWITEEQELYMGRLHRMDLTDPLVRDIASQVKFVTIYRVCGDLAVTRSIGDPDYKNVTPGETVQQWFQWPETHSKTFHSDLIIPTPEIVHVTLTRQHEFLIIASDGLWDVMNTTDAVNFVKDSLSKSKSKSTSQIAEELCELALRLGSSDNVTVVIVQFLHTAFS